ncbi:MAG: hypothetical protein J6J38_03980 [Lachnospiraceae bacterium]|nr:hypothetical protein [Lachnospiraceae bacterium]
MKKIAKKLTAVVVLAMMVVVGTFEGAVAEAATCPPHNCVDRYAYAEAPSNTSHAIEVMDHDTLQYHTETCYYTVQNFKLASICTKCFIEVGTYWKQVTNHKNVNCDLYGINEKYIY